MNFCPTIQILNLIIPYMVKLSSGKTFTFRVQNCYSQEKFHGSIACRLTLPIDKAIIHGKTFAMK